MATRGESIMAAIEARLRASGAVSSSSVYRDRGDTLNAGVDLPAIDLQYDRSDPNEFGAANTRHELVVRIDIRARESASVAPSTAADLVSEVGHRALMSDPTLGGLCRRLTLQRQQWRYQTSGDGTVVVLEQQYAAVHATRASDLAISA